MPVQLFTAAERERLDRFPDTVEHDDLVTFFTLSDEDKARIPVSSAASNRLGFALQLCTVRFIGFVPNALTSMPAPVVEHVANQLGVAPRVLASYGARAHTRTDHLQEVLGYLGYRRANRGDLKGLSRWLLERALEHDKASLLYTLTCERLRSKKILRPGVTRLEGV
jgi:TnpA family transposase